MSDPVEVELKLEYEYADRDRLIASPLLGGGGGEAKHLAATYFDTPDLQLHRAGYALRIRKDGTERVQTVKASSSKTAGLFVRGEWERPVRSDRPIIDARAGPLEQLLDETVRARIAPIFTTHVERHSGPVEQGGTQIEYAIDGGEVRAGQRSTTLSELELELISGSPQHLFDLARRLSETIPLRLGVQSKSGRGYALIGRSPALSAKAEPVLLDGAMNAGEAFAAIVGNCISQYRLNEALLLDHGGVEAIHQARVALRRMRSAFSLFKPLLADDDRAASLTDGLRWLAGELGNIRDIDVLIPRLQPAARETVAAIRSGNLTDLQKLLGTSRARLLPIDLAEWLAMGTWQRAPADPALRDQNIAIFAGDRLDRLRKRIRRKGKGLASLSDENRHEVRKDAKKLRYAADFLVSLYPGRKPRRRLDQLLDRIEALQDKLGQLNDIAAAPELLARLGLHLELPVIGKKERKRLLAEAEDCFDALVDTKRFWRS